MAQLPSWIILLLLAVMLLEASSKQSGLDELVKWLDSESPPLSESGKLMTTAAVARFKLPDSWAKLNPGEAKLQQLQRPREL